MAKRMKPEAYMKLYIGDWLQKTGRFDATCQGAYLLLIMEHWGKPGIQFNNEDEIRTLCRVLPQDWARVRGLLVEKFEIKTGLWINDRCVKEYAEAVEIYNGRLLAANAGAKGRWGVAQSVGNADAKPKASYPESEPQSESEKQLKQKASPQDSEEWLKELEKSPAYTGIDVRREFEKARIWIGLPQNKGRILNQRFFINWLNKIDKPLNIKPKERPVGGNF
jgi:uncharacterized protein YdaU (DUF1376 family)